jgi:hypothetical protein
MGFVVDKEALTEVGFLRILRFPLPSVPQIAPHSFLSIIIHGWYNRPVVASVVVDSFPLHLKMGKKESISITK